MKERLKDFILYDLIFIACGLVWYLFTANNFVVCLGVIMLCVDIIKYILIIYPY